MAEASLYWAPAYRLFEELNATSLDQDKLAELSKRYKDLLADGLSIFRAKHSPSRVVVQEQQSLFASSGPKVPVRADLKEAALSLSDATDLNEAQAYLIAWRMRENSSFQAASREERIAILVRAYFEERHFILGCWEALLQLRAGEEEEHDSPAVLEAASQLLADGLHGKLRSQLEQALGHHSLSPASPNSDGTTLATAPRSIQVQWQGVLAQQRMQEACTLMELQLLADSIAGDSAAEHARAWPPPSFPPLAKLLSHGLIAPQRPPELLAGAEQQRADHRAIILMLETLDLQQLLTLCAEGEQALDRALRRGAGAEVDAELQLWLHSPTQEHGPVLLAWAAASLLAQSLCPGQQHLSASASLFGERAWELHALQQMASILMHPGMQSEGLLADLCRRPMQCLLSTVLVATSLSAAWLPPAEMTAVAQCLEGIYDGQPELCMEVWGSDAADAIQPQAAPVRHWLHQLRALFPAYGGPFLQALRCLSASAASAISADHYLKAVSDVACLHQEQALAHGTAPERGSTGRFAATAWLTAAGLRGIIIPEGTTGTRIPAPQFAGAAGLGEAVDRRCLVSWQGFTGVGHHHLLCIVQTAVLALQQAVEDTRTEAHHANDMRGAVTELGTSLQLLSRFAAEAPAIILEMAHSTAIQDPEGGSITLAVLLVRAAEVLSKLVLPPAQLIGDGFLTLASLAINMPAHVKAEASSSRLLETVHPGGTGLAALPTDASLPVLESDIPAMRHLQRTAEAAAGHYPVTLAFGAMLRSLLVAGIGDADIQGWVGFAVGHILPAHGTWPYARPAERWELSAVLLHVLLAALRCPPSSGPGACSLRAATVAAMSGMGAASGCLAACLPPDAERHGRAASFRQLLAGASMACPKELRPSRTKLFSLCGRAASMGIAEGQARASGWGAGSLRQMVAHGGSGEAAAAQACALAWLELLPELLSAAAQGPCPGALATFLVQVPAPGVAAPATTLASYLGLPYLSCSQKSTALTALAAMSEACADMTTMSFAGCLPEGADGQVDAELRMQLVACFDADTAASDPGLLAAATKLASSAIAHHPSLVDVLCFPTRLKGPAPQGKENQAAGAHAPALPSISEQSGRPAASKPAGGSAAQQSCLDGVWSLLSQAATLYRTCPAALAHALQLLLALCEAGSVAARPLHLLRSQAGLWEHVAAAACMAPPGRGMPEARRAEHQADEDEEGQAERCKDAWRLTAQAHAARILALNCHLPGCQKALAVWKGRGAPELLQQLLKQLSPNAHQPVTVLRSLRHNALQATAELLVLCMSESSLEQRLPLPGSVLGRLHVLAKEAMTDHMTDAVCDSLLGMSERLSKAEGTELVDSSPEGTLATQLLQCGAVDALLAAACTARTGAAAGSPPVPGSEDSAAYDADRLAQLVGPFYAERLGSCVTLILALRHASTTAFQEQARLHALQAVGGLLTVLQRVPDSNPSLELSTAAATHAAQALSPVLSEFLTASLGGKLQPLRLGRQSFDWGVLLLHGLSDLSQVLVFIVNHLYDRRTSPQDSPASEAGARLELGAEVFQLCRAWLADRGGLASWCCEQDLPARVTRALVASAVLLARHAEAFHAAPAQRSSYQVAASLLLQPVLHSCSAAGQLAAAASQTAHTQPPDPGLALATALLRSQCTALDQAPPLQAQLARLLGSAVQGLLSSAAPWDSPKAMQALMLCQSLAQQPGTCAMLTAGGVLPAVMHVARLLLGQPAAGLRQAPPTPSSDASRTPDWGEAYTPSGQPLQAHRQWLAIISMFGSLLRVQPDSEQVSDAALALVVAGQARLTAALEPPACTAAQPLTLAGLQECERAAFLLSAMTRLAGAWQAALPGSMAAARRAASAFVALAALPAFRTSSSVRCPPVSPDERANAEVPAPVLQLLDGWFAVCADGSSTAHAGAPSASLTGSSRSPSRRPGRHITWSSAIPSSPHSPRSPRHDATGEYGSAASMSLEPRGSSLYRRLSRSPEASAKSMSVDAHSRRDSGVRSPSPMRQLSPTPQRGSGTAAAQASIGVSQYAAELADGVYAATAQTLSLLCSLAPEVSEEEAAAGVLGPEWPAPEVLRALQRQCVDVSHAAQSREHSARAKRLIMSLLAALHGSTCLLDRMHYFPTRHQSGERLAAEQAIERLQRAAGAREQEAA